MIVSNYIHPHQSLYFIGANILKLMSINRKPVDIIDLYQQYKNNIESHYSKKVYLLAITWLYITGVIDYDHNGDLRIVEQLSILS